MSAVSESDVWTELLAEIRGQVDDRRMAAFTHEDGRRVGLAALRIAETDSLPVVISVCRGRQRVFQAALDGTTPEHEDWVRRKENTAWEFEIPSLEFVARQKVSGRVPDWLDPLRYAVAGGSVPVLVGDLIAGTVTVSGIVGTPRGDHDLVMRALAAAWSGAA